MSASLRESIRGPRSPPDALFSLFLPAGLPFVLPTFPRSRTPKALHPHPFPTFSLLLALPNAFSALLFPLKSPRQFPFVPPRADPGTGLRIKNREASFLFDASGAPPPSRHRLTRVQLPNSTVLPSNKRILTESISHAHQGAAGTPYCTRRGSTASQRARILFARKYISSPAPSHAARPEEPRRVAGLDLKAALAR